MKYDMLIVGVGGQGILLVSEILSRAALETGLYVKKTETHGMAQMGGSVVTHIRISDKEVFSPLIPRGSADMVLAFEPLEALRYLGYLGENSVFIVNKNPVADNVKNYPRTEDVLRATEKQKNSMLLDAKRLAMGAGHPLTQNILMLGVASRYLPIESETIRGAIKKTVKRALDENLKAFELGSMIH